MNWKKRADALMARAPVGTGLRAVSSSRLAVLAYHAIENQSLFAQHLDYVQRDMRPVGLDDVVQAAQGVPLPARAVLITFDDGDRSVLEVALAPLAERGLPAVAFVVPGLLDSARPPWWVEVDALVRAGGSMRGVQGRTPDEVIRRMKALPDSERVHELEGLRDGASESVRQGQLSRAELRQLQAGGVEIGNHTLTHRYLSRCSEEVVEVEVREAHRLLEEALGHAPRAFAYPDRDRDPRALSVLRELGYEAAFLFDHRLNRLPLTDPLAISRVRVSSGTSMDRFRMIVSGVHPLLHGLRSRITRKEP